MKMRRSLIIVILASMFANGGFWYGVHHPIRADTTSATPPAVVAKAADHLDGEKARLPDPQPPTVSPTPAPAPAPTPKVKNPKPVVESTPVESAPAAVAPSDPISHFGVMIRPYSLKSGNNPYTIDQLTSQLDLAKQLGATDVRANVEQAQATNDDFVTESLARGLQPTFILETPPHGLDQDSYTKAYNFAKGYAARYKGQVRYYQLSNEASGTAIRPGYSGRVESDYDPNLYQKTKDIIRGFSEGVRAADGSAKRIVSANWLGVGIIDKLVADKVDFEIVGWNWYSDMGDDLIKKIDASLTLNIPEYLKQYGKEFWIVEANRAGGTADLDFNAQEQYLKALTKNVYSHHNVQGFFVYELADECGNLDQSSGHLGIVSIAKQDSGLCVLADKKPAFQTLQAAISRYSK